MSALLGLVPLQTQAPQGGLISFLPFILIFFIFYFLLIRPQQKRQKEHDAMLESIEKGDSVVTMGGIHGKVTGVTDDVLTLEIAALKGERVKVKASRSKIESVSKGNKGEES